VRVSVVCVWVVGVTVPKTRVGVPMCMRFARRLLSIMAVLVMRVVPVPMLVLNWQMLVLVLVPLSQMKP